MVTALFTSTHRPTIIAWTSQKSWNVKSFATGADEPVLLGPAYKCSISSECGFFIHRSCTQLSQEVNHPLHPDHTLSLEWYDDKQYCDACCRSHDRSFFYCCGSCDFYLDIKCANCLPTNPNDCHQHELFSFWRQIQFNCDACGEEIKNTSYLCSICKLLVHKRCATIPRTVKIKLHNHFLNLIYSPHEINKGDDMFFESAVTRSIKSMQLTIVNNVVIFYTRNA